MRTRDPIERSKNFKEVSLGITKSQAIKEAARCLQCKKPGCVSACPVEIDIPGFIAKIRDHDPLAAIDLIWKYNMLPAVCGRVCPQENQCQGGCILAKKGKGIEIGALERFAADYSAKNGLGEAPDIQKPNGHKVAIIGAGPAGLTTAGDLARQGYDVTIFEALHEAGGVLIFGIPEFRLPKKIIKREIEYVKSLGVKIRLNWVVGKTQTIDELFEEGFKAVFIGVGSGTPRYMQIPGENLNNVYFASEFLTRVNLMKADQFPKYGTPVKKAEKVAVVGAGNVAMDSARTALRLGAKKVYVVYRRTGNEMPARIDEVSHAMEEGIEFKFLTNPKEIIGDERGYVKGIKCEIMVLAEPDESGRRRPVRTGDEFVLDVDQVIVAIGQVSNPLLIETVKGLKLWGRGYIKTDENGSTNLPGVFAGGDIVTGAATVISAMGAGKRAARAIHSYISSLK
jgi:glutamate synthase (NADPH/NADH) small chain